MEKCCYMHFKPRSGMNTENYTHGDHVNEIRLGNEIIKKCLIPNF